LIFLFSTLFLLAALNAAVRIYKLFT